MSGNLRRIAGRARRGLMRQLSQHRLLWHTRRLHGPGRVTLGDDEVMLVLLARDVEWFLPTFLDHHFRLGVRHVLIIDNGSRDATLEICAGHDRVTVLRNLLPAQRHESALRSTLAQSVASGGWLLFADADELIELPVTRPDALRQLAAYCNQHGKTAVIGQMLDRFSTRPYHEIRDLDYPRSVREMRYYSLGQLESVAYDDPVIHDLFAGFIRDNQCEDPGVRLFWGGIESEAFGIRPLRSCHSMVRNLPTLTPMAHPHFASRVAVADVTLLIHHYKMAGDWIERERSSQRRALWSHGETACRLAAVGESEDSFRFSPVRAEKWAGVETLLEQGVLYASPRFRRIMSMQE